jgi:regulator of RNase E activity RraB
MQEYWELYMKNLEGKPASILFNAGISMEIDTIKYIYPTIAFVKVKLMEPNERGMLSEGEEPEIGYLEDKLEASLIKFRIGKYVGRVISDGYVTFLYYLQFTYNWQDFLNFALDEFEQYEITSGYQEDEAWSYYQKLLYPNSKEWQIIQNHRVCDQLKAKEDNLHLPRAIEHRLFFAENSNRREALLAKLEKEGFGVQSEIENEEGVKGISFYRIDKPFYHDIDELTLWLIDLLEEHGASYDGWETSIVKC